jgi:2-(1,2-epoxy-1,2-dihydrophenyl)acetyl-CoA isomerase
VVTSEETDGVVAIRIDRQDVRNSLDRASVMALIAEFEGVSQSVRCVVLRSEGTTFCSGGDLPHLERLASRPDEIRGSIEGSFQRLMRTIRRLPVPVIARVQGPAVGAGADLALACDLRLASDTAYLKESWIELGVISALGAPATLTAAGGPGFALDVLLSARQVGAQECFSRGLFQRVVPPDDLDSEVDGLASLIASRDPAAVRAMKELVAATFADGYEAILEAGLDRQEALMHSPDFAGRVRAILNRIARRA